MSPSSSVSAFAIAATHGPGKIFLHDAEEPFLLRVIRVKVVFGYLNCLVQTDFPITAGISFRNRGDALTRKVFLYDADDRFLRRAIRVKVVTDYGNRLVPTDFAIPVGISFCDSGDARISLSA